MVLKDLIIWILKLENNKNSGQLKGPMNIIGTRIMNLKNINFKNTDMPKGVQAMLGFGEYKLSIIQNETSYGSGKGLYEIGVFKNNDMVAMPGITAEGDTVKGFLSEAEVDVIIKKMHMVTGLEPTQVC